MSASAPLVGAEFWHPLLPEAWRHLDLVGTPFVDVWTGPEGGQLAVQLQHSDDADGPVNAGGGSGVDDVIPEL